MNKMQPFAESLFSSCKKCLFENNGDMPKEVLHQQTPSTMRSVSKRLRDAADMIDAVAGSLESHEITAVEMTHYDAVTRGMKLIEAFAGAARLAVLESLQNRGDFGGGTIVPANGKPATKATKKK